MLAMKPPKVCNNPHCPNTQPCPTHTTTWAGSTRRQRLPKNWATLRTQILKRDHHTCQQCGKPGNQIDHITHGDNHTPTNLQTLCTTCHNKKSAREGNLASQRNRKIW